MLSQIVEQRTKEIGVRMALGADSRDVFSSIVMVGIQTTLIGIALGFLGTLALGRVFAGLLFRVGAIGWRRAVGNGSRPYYRGYCGKLCTRTAGIASRSMVCLRYE